MKLIAEKYFREIKKEKSNEHLNYTCSATCHNEDEIKEENKTTIDVLIPVLFKNLADFMTCNINKSVYTYHYHFRPNSTFCFFWGPNCIKTKWEVEQETLEITVVSDKK